MKCVVLVLMFSLVISQAAAEVEMITSCSHELKDNVLAFNGGSKSVSIKQPDRTVLLTYKIDEDGREIPQGRTVTVVERFERGNKSTTTVEKYDHGDLVLVSRTSQVDHPGGISKEIVERSSGLGDFSPVSITTTISCKGMSETTHERVMDGQMTTHRRVIVTGESLPGYTQTTTTTEELKDGALVVTKEVRSVNITYDQLETVGFPRCPGMERIRFTGEGVQAVTITKTLVDNALKITRIDTNSQVTK